MTCAVYRMDTQTSGSFWSPEGEHTDEGASLAILRANRKGDVEPYWQDESDWLCTAEFFSTDDPEARLFAADIIGCLIGYVHPTNTPSLALLGDPEASAYELLVSFVSSSEKDQFLDWIRSNPDLESD